MKQNLYLYVHFDGLLFNADSCGQLTVKGFFCSLRESRLYTHTFSLAHLRQKTHYSKLKAHATAREGNPIVLSVQVYDQIPLIRECKGGSEAIPGETREGDTDSHGTRRCTLTQRKYRCRE